MSLPAEYPAATLRSAFINRARREGMRYFKQATVLVLIIALLIVAGAEPNDGVIEPAITEPSPAASFNSS